MVQDGKKIDPKLDQDGAENKKKEELQHKAEYFPSRCPILTEKVAKLDPSWVPKLSQNKKNV